MVISDIHLSQETEAYTIHLGQSIISGLTTKASELLGIGFTKAEPLHILDLCTGSGCIALQLHGLLSPHFSALEILGIDNSHKASALALRNLQSNVKGGRLHYDAIRQVRFAKGNIFDEDVPKGRWDVLIVNPPYISPQGFARDTSLSVRRYEPRTALIPSKDSVSTASPNMGASDQDVGDAFYPRLLEISWRVKAKLIVMEVANMHQAQRVARLALNYDPHAQCVVWRDWPDQASSRQELLCLQGKTVEVFGQGNGRAVIVKTSFQESAC